MAHWFTEMLDEEPVGLVGLLIVVAAAICAAVAIYQWLFS